MIPYIQIEPWTEQSFFFPGRDRISMLGVLEFTFLLRLFPECLFFPPSFGT